MAGMKNICGKISMELHAKMRQEIEQKNLSYWLLNTNLYEKSR